MRCQTITIIKFISCAIAVLATAGPSGAEGLSPEERGMRPPRTLPGVEIRAGESGDSTYLPKSLAPSDTKPTLLTPEPHTAQEHNNRAVECGMKGLWYEALKEHEAALMSEPTNKAFRTNLSAAHLRYGTFLLGKQNYERAEYQFRRALFVDPNNSSAKQSLDECLKKQAKGDSLEHK